MLNKNDKCEFIMNSNTDVNMSNWQVTHTLDTLTMVNNKFDILNMINKYLQRGIKKKNIFVTDKSFLINTNYKTYFTNDYELGSFNRSIHKMANLGRIISLEFNEELIQVNQLFKLYKQYSSIINTCVSTRLNTDSLEESYIILHQSNLETAMEELSVKAKRQLFNTLSLRIKPSDMEYSRAVEKMDRIKNNILNEFNRKVMSRNDTYEDFQTSFSRNDRPVVGIYDEEEHSFIIINANQMYQYGEEAENQLKLKSISKNSPVELIFIVTGTLLCFLGYLIKRDYEVNNKDVENEMLDYPQTDDEAVNNIIGNEDGNIINFQDVKIDNSVKKLAKINLEKLQDVVNKKKVDVKLDPK